MKKTIVSKITVLGFAFFLCNVLSTNAQPFTDNFNGPSLTSANAWTSWQSKEMFGYTPKTISAGPVFGNQWFWSNGVGLTPAAPAPFSAGGMIKFNSRNGGLAPAGAIDTGCAYIATPQLDYSGRNGAAANLSFYLWHEAYAGATSDSVVVYASNSNQLQGATRLGKVWADPAGYGNGWVQSIFAIPNVAQFNGCNKVIFMFVAYTWTSYRNIYVDNISIDRFPSNMVVQSATLTNQNTNSVASGSTNNQVVAVNINVCGSSTPKQLDSIFFNPTGTNIIADIANAKLFYTGNYPVFSTTQQVFATVNPPINNVTYNNSLGFGNCAAPITLALGDNYFWLTYDIKPQATAGDMVDADFLKCIIHGTCLPGGSIPFGVAQSLPGGLLIGAGYIAPLYTVGTSGNGYTSGDFISSVYVTSAVGNPLFNQEHDITTWLGCTGMSGQYCNRHAPHPTDYTYFAPTNNSITTDRSCSLNLGQGIRSGTVADKIAIAAGNWFSSNYVRAWIDFNSDGDFDDNYVGPGGTIYESIMVNGGYSLSDNNSIASLGTVAGAFPTLKKGDDWNEWNIEVPNDGELPTVGGGSGGPAVHTGYARLRIREVYANGTFTPFSTQANGECEDYDIMLVASCGIPLVKTCNWLGGGINPNNWFDAANWCPGIPTQYDTAMIQPNVNGNYPIIVSNQNPECATLRIFSGAQVTVDAPDVVNGNILVPNTGKLKVYHNIEIGEAPGTFAKLNVLQNPVNSVTTGIASSAGTLLLSPFRNDKQDAKIQFIYAPNELAIMGLKSGDVLDKITFYIKSATVLPSGNLGNFTVKIWQYDSTYSFPALLSPATEVAVNNALPGRIPSTGAINVTTCYGPSNFTVPAINQINTIVPVTINFTAKPSINVSRYLCFEISRDSPFTSGVAYPILYESTLPRYCLVLNNANNNTSSNTIAAKITGVGTAPGSAGVNANNGILNNGNFVDGGVSSPFSYITGSTYVFRPTSEIGFTRHYSKYNIEVGGNWINNNAPGLPLGFEAGYSAVKMINNYVPGLHPNNDVDTIGGSEVTIFSELEINDAKNVRMNVIGINNGNTGLIVDSTLKLTTGQLQLSNEKVVINNPNQNAIQRTTGFIQSQQTNNYNKVQWNIGNNTGPHTIPFGIAINYLPLTFNLVSGSFGNITASTYYTNAANTPLPVTPEAVTNLCFPSSTNNSSQMVDRYWQLNGTIPGGGVANIEFVYGANELPPGVNDTDLIATRFENDTLGACAGGTWLSNAQMGNPLQQSGSGYGYGTHAVRINNVSNFSPWSLTTKSSFTPPPCIVTGLKVTNATNTTAMLSWAKLSSATSYRVRIQNQLSNLNAYGVTVYTLDTFTLGNNFLPASAYRFRVAAKCNGVWGAWTAWKNFNTNVPRETTDEINFVDNAKPFLLYPNPASTNITIETGFDNDYQIKIMDTQGRLVYSNSYNAENELLNIDIAKLENGIYQLQIITSENIYLERVVVNR
ncbi:MAG TPA: BNR-repeat neuraminidase N-terminal domain-containing protein [Bacteroidia bacterium]|nr:BNR-repeat neuraminidase N-terminal domain-containing protein [Bacteroidia bacterium]